MSPFEFLRQSIREALRLLVRGPLTLGGIRTRIDGLHKLGLTSGAMLSRHMGSRVIIFIGLGASLYAVVMFLTGQITPDSPKASHDAILKTRWSSPKPSSSIVIVDVDERSLAILAPEHGRWPWPRIVLADGLDRLSQAGARAVLFNVLLSDPDKSNPDSDAATEAASVMIPNVAYPVVRLNQDNDEQSQLKASDLLKRTGDPHQGLDDTVAVLMPMFGSMIEKSGIANQKPDGDGIVRKYAVVWSDSRLTMPSIVARTLIVSGQSLNEIPNTITLNWRNKSSRYSRMSFADLMKAEPDDEKLKLLKGAYIVLGVSAPGLGMTKATAVFALEDDNEILATALDDVLSDSHLRVMPAWMVLIIELGTVWILVWIGVGRSLGALLNKVFVLAQSGAASITMASASYTHYLIDLTTCMAFGAGIFAAIKVVNSLDAGWSRAKPGHRVSVPTHSDGIVLLIGYKDSQVDTAKSGELQRFLESQVGLHRVIRVDDLFGGESFARKVCEDYSCQFCLVEIDHSSELMTSLKELPFYNQLNVRKIPLDGQWNPELNEFRLFIAPNMLRQCADIVEGGFNLEVQHDAPTA